MCDVREIAAGIIAAQAEQLRLHKRHVETLTRLNAYIDEQIQEAAANGQLEDLRRIVNGETPISKGLH